MKKIRFFKQHTMETCGICCLMMVLDYFGIEFPTISKEQQLYYRYRIREYPGVQGSAIAHELSRRGLEVSLVHSSENLIDNQDEYFSPQLHAVILENHLSYINRPDRAFEIRTGSPITCDVLRWELSRKRLVILQCMVEGNADGLHQRVLHGILLYDFDGDTFFICDPAYKKTTLTADELKYYMNTPAGRMYISAGLRGE